MKTEILSAENKWQQTQFKEKMGKYRKSKLKNIVKYNLLGLLVFHVTILWLTDFKQLDLGAITKPMQASKVSEPTFCHQIKQCLAFYLA